MTWLPKISSPGWIACIFINRRSTTPKKDQPLYSYTSRTPIHTYNTLQSCRKFIQSPHALVKSAIHPYGSLSAPVRALLMPAVATHLSDRGIGETELHSISELRLIMDLKKKLTPCFPQKQHSQSRAVPGPRTISERAWGSVVAASFELAQPISGELEMFGWDEVGLWSIFVVIVVFGLEILGVWDIFLGVGGVLNGLWKRACFVTACLYTQTCSHLVNRECCVILGRLPRNLR